MSTPTKIRVDQAIACRARAVAASFRPISSRTCWKKSEEGLHLGARNIYTDPELFELEVRHIFEGNWVYAARTLASCPTPTIFFADNRTGSP